MPTHHRIPQATASTTAIASMPRASKVVIWRGWCRRQVCPCSIPAGACLAQTSRLGFSVSDTIACPDQVARPGGSSGRLEYLPCQQVWIEHGQPGSRLHARQRRSTGAMAAGQPADGGAVFRCSAPAPDSRQRWLGSFHFRRSPMCRVCVSGLPPIRRISSAS